MYDAFAQFPGLQALSLMGVGAVQGRSLSALSGLSTSLVGATSYGSPSFGWQTVNVSAGLSGYLGSGQVSARRHSEGYASAASGQVQGNTASYQANWAANTSQHGHWHTVGGQSTQVSGSVNSYPCHGHRPHHCDAMLDWQTGCSKPTTVQTSWSQVPHVNTESEWPAASKVVATRLVGSSDGQSRIHFGGKNPWSNSDGNSVERTAVWKTMQRDSTLRYDVDRKVFFRTNSDGSTTDVAGVQGQGSGSTITSLPVASSTPSTPATPTGSGNAYTGYTTMPSLGSPSTGIPGSYTSNGNPSTGIPSEYTNYTGYTTMPSLGSPSTGIPGAYTGNGNPSSGIPSTYLDNGNPATGIPSSYTSYMGNGGNYTGYTTMPSLGSPSAGIPGAYTSNGNPSTGIPSMYLDNGNPSTGIPSMYLQNGNPATGIPYPYVFGYL